MHVTLQMNFAEPGTYVHMHCSSSELLVLYVSVNDTS